VIPIIIALTAFLLGRHSTNKHRPRVEVIDMAAAFRKRECRRARVQRMVARR
jgi:hypothetical protein